jgi:hypothetical protein
MKIVSRTFEPGDLIIYPYRWPAEAQSGRSPDGAKDRPCCVVISMIDAQRESLILLAPISSQPPRSNQAALEIPDIERHRGGLSRYDRGWVYVGEMNPGSTESVLVSRTPGADWVLQSRVRVEDRRGRQARPHKPAHPQ